MFHVVSLVPGICHMGHTVVNDHDKVDMMGMGGKKVWEGKLAGYRGIV